jgi:hypothetical protein
LSLFPLVVGSLEVFFGENTGGGDNDWFVRLIVGGGESFDSSD